MDGGLKLAHTGGSRRKQISVTALVEIAKKYKAEITPDRQIRWMDMNFEWIETLQFRPSVLDAVILANAPKVGPSYLEAAQAATGWPRQTLLGFSEIMLVGRPLKSAIIQEGSRMYWKGIAIGLFVYGKLRRH